MASKNPEVRNAASRRYRQRHKEKLAAQSRAYARKNPDIYRKSAIKYYYANRDTILAKKYGISLEEFQALPKECQLCGSTHRLCVDHEHSGGLVRGILCNGCNAGIGHFKENLFVMIKAIKYLRASRPKPGLRVVAAPLGDPNE